MSKNNNFYDSINTWDKELNKGKRYRIIAGGTATCKKCRDMDGEIFDMADASTGYNMPPFHPNCKCKIEMFDDESESNFAQIKKLPSNNTSANILSMSKPIVYSNKYITNDIANGNLWKYVPAGTIEQIKKDAQNSYNKYINNIEDTCKQVESYNNNFNKINDGYMKMTQSNSLITFNDDKRYKNLMDRVNNFNNDQYKKDFVLEVFPLALNSEKETGIPAEIIFGQLCTESGYGQGEITLATNNYFGITGKEVPGAYYYRGNWFLPYDSFEESFADYIRLMDSKYRQYVTTGTPEDWANALVKGGYCDENYGKGILDVARTWRVY